MVIIYDSHKNVTREFVTYLTFISTNFIEPMGNKII